MPGYGSRYWDERTPSARRRSHPVFKGRRTADVVVIGGGLTGCTAAYVFARAGLDVVLVEAARLASGATAGGLGLVLPDPEPAFADVASACGVRVARTAFRDTRRAALDFATAIRRQGIRCDLAPVPMWTNARDAVSAATLRRDQVARKRAGLSASWATPKLTAAEIGTDTAGALVTREAAVVDPVKATLGLAAAARDAGAAIFERSSVRRTRFSRRLATVTLANGAIETPLVYVATGSPGALFPQLRRHVQQRTGYVVVTTRLPAAVRRELGKRRTLLGEAGADPGHWLRWLDDRAMFAGAASAPAGARLRDKAVRQRTAQLMYELSVRYPAISGLPAEYGWDVPVVSTEDGLPWIGPHRNYPFHFFTMAPGWHGEASAWLGARAGLRYLKGEATRQDDVFGFQRRL